MDCARLRLNVGRRWHPHDNRKALSAARGCLGVQELKEYGSTWCVSKLRFPKNLSKAWGHLMLRHTQNICFFDWDFTIFTYVVGENLALKIVKMWEELLETSGNTCWNSRLHPAQSKTYQLLFFMFFPAPILPKVFISVCCCPAQQFVQRLWEVHLPNILHQRYLHQCTLTKQFHGFKTICGNM